MSIMTETAQAAEPRHFAPEKCGPTELVNLRQGTDSSYYFSTGNTLPLVAAPFGAHHWTVETEEDPVRFFHPGSRSFRGLRLTHQPSPWIGDYAALRLMPQTGRLLAGRRGRTSCFDPGTLELRPHRMRAELLRYRTTLEFAPTSRCGVLRLLFPDGCAKRLFVDLFDAAGEWREGSARLTGFVTNHTGGVPENFRMHFLLEFSAPVIATGEAESGCFCEFDPSVTELEVRIGASFLSPEQAARNLESEVGDAGFREIAERGRRRWDELLGLLTVEADEEMTRTFTGCLYRTFLFPREFHEFDAAGEMVHYSPYDGKVHPGPLYADNGFWDTHRTVYPLFSLLLPEKYGEMISGWLNAAREGGWFPRWSSPGYRSCMTGTHIDAVIADAAAKGIGGFDLRACYEYMLKNGLVPVGGEGLYGRRKLEEYLRLGYVPDEACEHAAARTMDYAANDFCIAEVARLLGDTEREREFRRRGGNWRNLFDPATGVLRGRRGDGSFAPEFNPVEWSRTYIEGSSWQCGFAVPHDPAGFIRLLGGPEAMTARIDAMLAEPPDYEVGAYGEEIHEMTEMAAAGFGQYAQSNQPSHHILWFYTLAGRRDKAAAAVRRVAAELYSPDRFPGDEDNGEMSAWYLFAVAGFYPFCPGRPEYVGSAPLASRITFRLPRGRVLTVCPSPDGAARFDGVPVDPAALPHAMLAGGGVLEL